MCSEVDVWNPVRIGIIKEIKCRACASRNQRVHKHLCWCINRCHLTDTIINSYLNDVLKLDVTSLHLSNIDRVVDRCIDVVNNGVTLH